MKFKGCTLISVIFSCIIYLSCISTTIAMEADSLFSKAMSYQLDSSWTEALTIYDSLEAVSFKDPALYNNMGLCYAAKGELGLAIAFFKRGLKYFPGHKAINNNLMSVTAQIKQPVGAFEESKGLSMVYESTGLYWQLLSLASIFLMALLLGLAYYMKRPKLRSFAWIFMFVGLFGFIVLKLKNDYLIEHHYAVVIKEKVGIRQDPQIENIEIEYLSEGVTVKLLEQKDGWSYIELPNKLVGWVLSPMIKNI